MTVNRMRMALTILLLGIPSRIFTRSCEKGPGNGTILANGKGFSRIPFRTEKEDYLWRLSPICVKDFPENCLSISPQTEISGFLAKLYAPSLSNMQIVYKLYANVGSLYERGILLLGRHHSMK